jgi:hypothetical protein
MLGNLEDETVALRFDFKCVKDFGKLLIEL